MEQYRNFIAGKWRNTSSGRTAENINPADTSDVIGLTPLSTADEAREAIAAAQAAFPAWRSTPAPQRGQIVARAATLLAERLDPLGRTLTHEEGKILREAKGEIQKAVNVIEFMAGEARRFNGETIPSELPRTFAYTIKQPLGVVGVITPWNFPVCIPCWKIAPALVAGNTVVFKPATITPGTAVEVVEIFEKAGLPAGVLNLVIGSGREVGQTIIEDPRVKAVSFTGSNEVGVKLYTDGAARLKKVQCEMGGKNPIVILEDADLDLACESTAQGAFGSTGQRCTATSRAIVVESVADAFVKKLRARAERIRVGNGLDESVDMGPSVDAQQFETVQRYLHIAREEDALFVTGGHRLEEGALKKGYFTAPTVLDRVHRRMRVAREEIFGPVLSVLRVKDFDEALEVANDCDFGLSSSIYTNDMNRVMRFIDGIETGITHVNSPTMGGEAQLPFGGVKATGVGQREQGRVALDFFSEWKTVYIDYTGAARKGNLY